MWLTFTISIKRFLSSSLSTKSDRRSTFISDVEIYFVTKKLIRLITNSFRFMEIIRNSIYGLWILWFWNSHYSRKKTFIAWETCIASELFNFEERLLLPEILWRKIILWIKVKRPQEKIFKLGRCLDLVLRVKKHRGKSLPGQRLRCQR